MTQLLALFEALDAPSLKTIAVGCTGYLDQLKSADMSAPVMKGVDEHGRKFIALSLVDEFVTVAPGVELMPGFDEKTTGVLVVFQRYSERTDIWAVGSRHLNTMIAASHGNVSFERVWKLLNRELVSVPLSEEVAYTAKLVEARL